MTRPTCTHCDEYALASAMTRRDFLGSSLMSAAGLLFGRAVATMPAWMPRVTLADPHVGPRGDTLVCVFLRGGADGLNIIVPHGDPDYYQQRPTLAIPRPDDGRAEARALDLDGFFGLHPVLEPLQAIYQAGHLAPVQATGSPDESRSHFEAMDLMERGAATGDYTGWLARHLASLDTGNSSALRAVSVGDLLPASLSGSLNATALQSVADYHLRGRDDNVGQLQGILSALYQGNDDLLAAAASQTFAAIEALSRINVNHYQPAGRDYPQHPFGQAMKVVGQLVRNDVGVEVACVDYGGWDTHVAQGSTGGQMANQLANLGAGLAAFYEDIQEQIGAVTVVVMSEFGRRVAENGGLGTDHGHGNMMLLMGGNVAGGKVHGAWPGLNRDVLVGPGDLDITVDYRDILGEIVARRLNNPNVADVFPGYSVTERGVVQG